MTGFYTLGPTGTAIAVLFAGFLLGTYTGYAQRGLNDAEAEKLHYGESRIFTSTTCDKAALIVVACLSVTVLFAFIYHMH